MTDDGSIHTGYWTDWSRGRIHGQLLTIRASNSLLLIAALTYFVCLVSYQAWYIIRFILHQTRSDANARDGLYHQRQVILRNDARPESTLFYLCRTTIVWRSRVAQIWTRQVPLIGISIAHILCWLTVALFVSRIGIVGENARLLVNGYQDCGFRMSDDPAFYQHQSHILQSSSSRLQDCASDNTNAKHDESKCQTRTGLVNPSISFDTQSGAACPFANATWCQNPTQYPLRMTSELISDDHLGINVRPENRISYRREMTCSLLPDEPDGETVQETLSIINDGVLLQRSYRYLSWAPDLGKTEEPLRVVWSNITGLEQYHFVTRSVWSNNTDAHGADINALHTIDGLMPKMADLDVIVMSSGAKPPKTFDDGLFRATDGQVRPLTVFACATSHQFCNPNNGLCTRKGGWYDIGQDSEDKLHFRLWNNDGLSTEQQALIYAFRTASRSGSLSNVLSTLQSQALLVAQSQNPISNSAPVPVSSNQTSKEMQYWFSIGLAALQEEFSTLPSTRLPFNRANDIEQHAPELRQLCQIKTTSNSSYISISLLGLCILLALGSAIIIISLALPTLWHRRPGLHWKNSYAYQEWKTTGLLNLLRMAFEAKTLGTWTSKGSSMSVTMPYEKFTLPLDHRSGIGESRNPGLLIDTGATSTHYDGPLSSHPLNGSESTRQSTANSSSYYNALPTSSGSGGGGGIRIASDPNPSEYSGMLASMPPGSTRNIGGVRYTALSTGNTSRERGKSLLGLLPPVILHRDSERPASWIMPRADGGGGGIGESSEHGQTENLLGHARTDSEGSSGASSVEIV